MAGYLNDNDYDDDADDDGDDGDDADDDDDDGDDDDDDDEMNGISKRFNICWNIGLVFLWVNSIRKSSRGRNDQEERERL